MGLSIVISLLFLVIVLYIQVVDVFSILFRVSGMTKEQARFQTVSLVTNSGFTARESEIILAVPARRRIARTAMMFGLAFSAAVVSLIVGLVASIPQDNRDELWPVLITVTLILVIYLLIRQQPGVQAYFDRKVEEWAKKKIQKRTNTVVLLDEFRQDALMRVYVQRVPKALRGKSIQESGVQARYGLRFARLERGKRAYTKSIKKMTLQDGDSLIVLGEYLQAEELFNVDGSIPLEAPAKKPNKKKPAAE